MGKRVTILGNKQQGKPELLMTLSSDQNCDKPVY